MIYQKGRFILILCKMGTLTLTWLAATWVYLVAKLRMLTKWFLFLLSLILLFKRIAHRLSLSLKAWVHTWHYLHLYIFHRVMFYEVWSPYPEVFALKIESIAPLRPATTACVFFLSIIAAKIVLLSIVCVIFEAIILSIMLTVLLGLGGFLDLICKLPCPFGPTKNGSRSAELIPGSEELKFSRNPHCKFSNDATLK